MSKTNLEQLLLRLESYLECWKQFNTFMALARSKKFSPEDENQFLELKSVLTQELELILSAIDCGPVSREDVHALISSAPSLRNLGDMNDGALRNVENHWHKLYISLQSILGQLKVRQQQMDKTSVFKGWFARKAA
jgi:hypothetical protein